MITEEIIESFCGVLGFIETIMDRVDFYEGKVIFIYSL